MSTIPEIVFRLAFISVAAIILGCSIAAAANSRDALAILSHPPLIPSYQILCQKREVQGDTAISVVVFVPKGWTVTDLPATYKKWCP